LAEANKLDEADKQRLILRCKAHGYQLRIKGEPASPSVTPSPLDVSAGDRPTLNAALDANEIPQKLSDKIRLASTPPPPPDANAKAAKPSADETVKIKALGPTQASLALG